MRKFCTGLIMIGLGLSAACTANPNSRTVPTSVPTLVSTSAPTQLSVASETALPDTLVSATVAAVVSNTAVVATATLAVNPTATAVTLTETFTPSPAPATETRVPTQVPPTATVTVPIPTSTVPPTVLHGDTEAGAVSFQKRGCKSCHMPPQNARRIAPDLSHIDSDAARFIHSPEYQGHATDTASYVRESILQPNAFVVPAFRYLTADGSSIMPGNFGTLLSPQELEDLIAYVLSLAQ